jgi:sec-independent protein translocase protein TatA
MFGVGTTELILIVIVILLLFGAGRIPAVMGGLGKGIKEFKKAFKGDDEPVVNDALAQMMKPAVGKHVKLFPDGTLEIGLPDGATLVEVDQSWATLQTDGSNEKIPLVQVKRIVFRA